MIQMEWKVERKFNPLSTIVYLRMKDKIQLKQNQRVALKDIAYISTDASIKEDLQNMFIYQITEEDKNIVVLDCFIIIDFLRKYYPQIQFEVFGAEQTIINVKEKQKKPSIFLIVLVWFLLFIGTAMTIMNFHYDVSMQEVQQKLHYLLTGEKVEFPLWIQIPYSLGLGVGMLLFFNHWFKKRINEEPSPIEVELFNYQEALNNYIKKHENVLYDHKHPD